MDTEIYPNETENQLVGRCPICPDPESSTDHSDAYNGSTIADSDKDVYLVWSAYYQQWVCRLCKIEGIDFTVDDIRDQDDRNKEISRTRMGFRQTYVTNSIS